MQSRVYVTVGCPFVHLSHRCVRLVWCWAPAPRRQEIWIDSCRRRHCIRCRTCRQWHKKVQPWSDSNLAWWLTLARCGRSSNVQTRCRYAPQYLVNCCTPVTDVVSRSASQQLMECHDIGYPLLDAEHSLCTAPWSGTPCRTTSLHSRTMSPLDGAWKPRFSPDNNVFSALETFVIITLYK